MRRFICLAAAGIAACGAPAGDGPPAAPDSVMEARMTAGWSTVREYWATRMDPDSTGLPDPQWALAREYFDYFAEHPDEPTGRKAGVNALIMWGNLPAADSVSERIHWIPADSPVWADALSGISNAYARSDRWVEIPDLFRRLEGTVTHAEGRSALDMHLAADAVRTGDSTGARARYGRVIERAAVPFDVQKARSALYEMDSLRVGQPAPGIDALSIDGAPVRLAELRGKVVLVEFWSTTCGPCMPLIPFLKAMHEELPAGEFALIGVTDDDDMDVLRAFLADRSMTWTQIRQRSEFSEQGVLEQDPVWAAFNVFGIPRSFLIDRDGRIAAKDLRNERLDEATRSLVLGGA